MIVDIWVIMHHYLASFPVWIKRWLQAIPGRSVSGLAKTLSVDRTAVSHWISGRVTPFPVSHYWPHLLDELGLSADERAEAHRLAGIDPLCLLSKEERERRATSEHQAEDREAA